MASSAPNGSSIRSTSASWASARASATRWRMPPDSSCGRFSAKSAEVHHLEQLRRCARAARSRGDPTSFSASSTLPRTVSHGNSADSWNISAVRLARHLDRARGRLVEPGDEVEQRALAAAGRAEQAHELTRRDVEADAVERVHGAATVAEHLRDVDDGDGRRRDDGPGGGSRVRSRIHCSEWTVHAHFDGHLGFACGPSGPR